MLTNLDYTIGWITALDIELAACQAILDDPLHPILTLDAEDSNNYTLGQLGPHNVVIACLPSMGNNAAATAAANMVRSFPNVRIGLMIGVGGGVPDCAGHDIRLGDIVVSYPKETHGGVIQFDFGTVTKDKFIRKGYLNRPPSSLLTALNTLKAKAERKGYDFERHVKEMLERNPMMINSYGRPEADNLYESKYDHPGAKADCSNCSDEALVKRTSRKSSRVHYGLIGSSNSVVRDPVTRDNLCKDEGIICFEMEAAGLMCDFPCLVIRGICDYCDTHKNKSWQCFASANAAAFAKELFTYVSPVQVEGIVRTNRIVDELKSQTEKQHDLQCLARLRITDPRVDKKHLEDMKGGLLRESYIWILQNAEFKTWRRNTDKKLLWIHGDPGKGKTMLLCGIIDELSKEQHHLSYFFCRATENQHNTAVSVLRGVIFMLADQQPSLIKHIRKYTDKARGSIFEDPNAWFTLADILKDCLNDGISQVCTIVVDALDECIQGREKLTSFIISCSKSHSTRWIISSRNWPEIEKDLKISGDKDRISLEINASCVTTAVQRYIDHRVNLIAERQDYDDETRTKVSDHLHRRAQGTFLWVALSCNHLESLDSWESVENLRTIPPGLDGLYGQMLRRILESRHSPVLQQILALTILAYRPLNVDELSILVEVDTAILRSPKFIYQLVGMCGSFLTIKDSRIEVIHQSAKDFLLGDGYAFIFPLGLRPFHKQIYSKSIEKLELVLRKDIYALEDPGIMIEDVAEPVPNPLGQVKYSCVYWIDHFVEYIYNASGQNPHFEYVESILHFFETQYVYWLEATSLLKEIYVLNSAMVKLNNLSRDLIAFKTCFQIGQDIRFVQLAHIVQDALQFVRYFQHALLHFPLQIYVSGLLFSPQDSIIKRLFRHESPTWAQVRRGLSRSWPSGLNLEFDIHPGIGLYFSPDSKQIAAVSDNQSVLCGWEVSSGRVLYTIPMSGIITEDSRSLFSFLGNDRILTCDPSNMQIDVWSVPDAQLLRTIDLQEPTELLSPAYILDEYDYHDMQTAFSADSVLFAYGTSISCDIQVYETLSGTIKRTLKQANSELKLVCLAFSPDNLNLAVSEKNAISIWNIEMGRQIWKNKFSYATCIFSPSGRHIALANRSIELWNWTKNELVWSLEVQSVYDWPAIAFVPSVGTLMFSNGNVLEELSFAGSLTTIPHMVRRTNVGVLACSPDGRTMAAAESWSNIHVQKFLSDATNDFSVGSHLPKATYRKLLLKGDRTFLLTYQQEIELHIISITNQNPSQHEVVRAKRKTSYHAIEFSDDRHLVAFADADLVEIWDLKSMKRTQTIEIETEEGRFCGLRWNPDGVHITVVDSKPEFLSCWNTITGNMIKRWAAPQWNSVTLSEGIYAHVWLVWCPNERRLITVYGDTTDVWSPNTESWQNLVTDLDNRPLGGGNLIFSSDSEKCAYVSVDRTIMVWNLTKLELLLKFPSQGVPRLLILDNHRLETDRGSFEISSELELGEAPKRHAAFHINVEMDRILREERSWIRLGIRNLIWVPGEYKPLSEHNCEDVDGDRVAICIGLDALVVDFIREKWLDEESKFEFRSKKYLSEQCEGDETSVVSGHKSSKRCSFQSRKRLKH